MENQIEKIAERRAIDLMRRVGRQRAREIHAPLVFESYADEGADRTRSSRDAPASNRVHAALAMNPAARGMNPSGTRPYAMMP